MRPLVVILHWVWHGNIKIWEELFLGSASYAYAQCHFFIFYCNYSYCYFILEVSKLIFFAKFGVNNFFFMVSWWVNSLVWYVMILNDHFSDGGIYSIKWWCYYSWRACSISWCGTYKGNGIWINCLSIRPLVGYLPFRVSSCIT